MGRCGRILVFVAIGALLMAGSRRSEYEIKAAFLYKFAAAVDWPAGVFQHADEPLVVGVIGEDPFGDDLEQVLADKSVNGRPLALQRYAELALLRPCHVLFIAESEADRLDALLKRLTDLPVLVVTDNDVLVESAAAANGVMISFSTERRKIRFSVNKAALDRAGMSLTDELLELAAKP
jgi:hypothetical protein